MSKAKKVPQLQQIGNIFIARTGSRKIEVLDRLDKAVRSRRMFVLLASLPQLFDSLSKKTYVEC